jgi:hypothetical protein
MEGLQFAQQQLYKVHFLLASKISLFISEEKNTNLGRWAKLKKNERDHPYITSAKQLGGWG